MSAKTNKSHKQRVEKFKNNLKKSRNMSELKQPESPISQQFPIWNAQDKFEITGLELESIVNLTNIFAPAVINIQSIVQRNLQSGKIGWKFLDAEGKDVPDEVVKKYQEELNTFFAAQQKQQQAKIIPITAEEQKGLPRIDALVDATGKELVP